jgi:hypothetical protein
MTAATRNNTRDINNQEWVDGISEESYKVNSALWVAGISKNCGKHNFKYVQFLMDGEDEEMDSDWQKLVCSQVHVPLELQQGFWEENGKAAARKAINRRRSHTSEYMKKKFMGKSIWCLRFDVTLENGCILTHPLLPCWQRPLQGGQNCTARTKLAPGRSQHWKQGIVALL